MDAPCTYNWYWIIMIPTVKRFHIFNGGLLVNIQQLSIFNKHLTIIIKYSSEANTHSKVQCRLKFRWKPNYFSICALCVTQIKMSPFSSLRRNRCNISASHIRILIFDQLRKEDKLKPLIITERGKLAARLIVLVYEKKMEKRKEIIA